MVQKLLALFGKFRRVEDNVIDARLSALGKAPGRRNRQRPVSPFKYVARAAA